MPYKLKSLKKIIGGGPDMFEDPVGFSYSLLFNWQFWFSIVVLIIIILIPTVFLKEQVQDSIRYSRLRAEDRICAKLNNLFPSSCEKTIYNKRGSKCIYNRETSEYNTTCWTKSGLEKQQEEDGKIY